MFEEKAPAEVPAPAQPAAQPAAQPMAAQPAAQPSLLRKGLIAGWWNPMLDRYGPKNPALRFVVDLVPFLLLFGVLAIAYLVSR